MAGLGNNLYPTIFKNAYAPAFDKTNPQGCRIYFSLSPYNSLGDFAKYESSGKEVIADLVQVSIQNQNTNYSALLSFLLCPLNVLVGTNSPSLLPTISSVIYTGTCFLPS